MGKEIGIFGVGPGTVVPVHELQNATIFTLDTPAEMRSIYTTGQGYENFFSTYVPSSFTMPMDSIRLVSAEGADFKISTGDRYFMIDYPALVEQWSKSVREKLVKVPKEAVQNMSAVEHPDGVTVNLEGKEYEFSSVIDGTGVRAAITKLLLPESAQTDFAVEWVCCGTFPGRAPDGELILVFGPGGGSSWINKSIYSEKEGQSLVDVVFSGWGFSSYFPQFISGDGRARMEFLREFADKQIPGVRVDNKPVNITYGMIRSQPGPKPQLRHIFPVGEAAGVARPKTGGSFNRSLISGDIAKSAIELELTPQQYYRKLRRRWKRDDFFFAITLVGIERQLDGKMSDHANSLQRWIEEGRVDEDFVRKVEAFFIDGRWSFELLLKFFGETELRKSLLKAMRYMPQIKRRKAEHIIPPTYGFMEIDKLPKGHIMSS